VPYPLFDLYSLLTAHLASQPLRAAAGTEATAEIGTAAAGASSTAQKEQSRSMAMRRDIFWTRELR
jgi:hypothetical protein